jgi:hypothetical protein
MASTRDTGEEEKSAFASTSFLLSALFLVGVVAAVVILAATGPARGTAAAPPPAAIPAALPSLPPSPTRSPIPAVTAGPSTGAQLPPGAGTATGSAASVCGLSPGAQVVPASAPAGSWQIVAGIAVPLSPVFGPARLVGGIGSCYAHNPTGALFAMMDTLALTQVPSDQIPAVAVVTGRGSRSGQYLHALAAAKAQDGAGTGSQMPSDPSTTPKVTLLGFRFVDYTPGRAAIAVAVGVGDPSMSGSYQPAMLTAVVTWEGGDWKFVYSDQTGATAAPIISTQQYTAWAA